MRKIFAFVVSFAFYSCSSDKVKSSENYIEEFSLGNISPIEVNVRFGANVSLIYVWTEAFNIDSLSSAKKEIKISANASLDSIGTIWTEPNFKYIVTAENGEKREYSVQIDTAVPKRYSFESWILSNGNSGYFVPSNLRWASGNPGIEMALAVSSKDNGNPENYPTRKTDKGHAGNAVILETMEGLSVFGLNIPIFSGNFFLGNFNTSKAISNPLAATEVGRIYLAKPKSVRGYYKYKEGKSSFISSENAAPNRPDSCNMHIAFYQSDLPNGTDTTLTVENIDDSELVLAQAALEDCSETAGDGFHEFILNFGPYKSEPDFENHRYKLVITFAASRGGGTYEGKIGSNLVIDEVEIEDY